MIKKTIVAVCSVALLAGCAPAAYNAELRAEDIEHTLADHGIAVCTERAVSTEFSPGIVDGRSWTLSDDCVMDPQAMRVTVLRFDSEAGVHTAMRTISSIHRNGFGPHFAYALGPYVISLEGDRPWELQKLLGEALVKAGATP